MEDKEKGFILTIVKKFLSGHASILLILFSLFLGAGAVWLTPREEEPQIVVPMADIMVTYPGASAREVEHLVTTPLERLLWQVDGVEYVYSVAHKDFAIVTVRFYVKEDRERSFVKLYNRVESHIDQVSKGITGWIIKPVEIDDVPIVTFNLYSKEVARADLRRIAEEASARLAETENISRLLIHGGEKREIRVELDLERMAANNLSPLEVYHSLKSADAAMTVGGLSQNNKSFSVKSGPFFKDIEEVSNVVIAVRNQKIVRLKDIAMVLDGVQENQSYTRMGFGVAADPTTSPLAKPGDTFPSVTISVSKKKGTNAVQVAKDVIARMRQLQKKLFPSNVFVEITRNNGAIADQKVNELLSSLFFAIVGVVSLIALTMGWREALVVALAVPISFSLSLSVNFIFGYTINRVTLFALILSLGLVVDDPITNVDNIQRHILLGRRDPFEATLFAVQEVLPPVLLSTLAIIISFLPMFFITGMMGPYMEPMAINVPLTVTFSTICALTFVPWASYQLLKHLKSDAAENGEEKQRDNTNAKPALVERVYRAVLSPFLNSRLKRILLLFVTVGILASTGLLVLFRLVPLKMLPFDNKNEFQILVDMPEGTTLEETDSVIKEMEKFLAGVHEVTNFQSYVGLSSPMDFNGLVRHYYLRRGNHLGDIRVNFLPKDKREAQSHNIVLRLRKRLKEIGDRYSAHLEIVEVPPGPPVLATMVAEIYGREDLPYAELVKAARTVEKRMKEEPFLVDVDTTIEDRYEEYEYFIEREKAALNGVSTEQINSSLRLALKGLVPASLHSGRERNQLSIRCILPQDRRFRLNLLENIKIRGKNNKLVSIGEIGEFRKKVVAQPIYHKNLKRVIFVKGEMAGRPPGEAIIDLLAHFRKNPLPAGITLDWAGEGEWKITLDVFRDLGLAFGAAMVGIYFLLVLETSSFSLPMLIMLAIPLTAIGIMPGFFLLNLFVNKNVGGFNTPVFFTATGMIGMIALGGIVVRNAIVLIEFIQDALKEGVELKEAILQSGAVRFRPILLTAGTTMLGAWPITMDPVFSGLAWSLIFGLFASTLFTLLIVPTAYYMIFGGQYEAAEAN
ncbi:efflux RND transporter permease subunit [Candidatus Riflebacteria bacterium]